MLCLPGFFFIYKIFCHLIIFFALQHAFCFFVFTFASSPPSLVLFFPRLIRLLQGHSVPFVSSNNHCLFHQLQLDCQATVCLCLSDIWHSQVRQTRIRGVTSLKTRERSGLLLLKQDNLSSLDDSNPFTSFCLGLHRMRVLVCVSAGDLCQCWGSVSVLGINYLWHLPERP